MSYARVGAVRRWPLPMLPPRTDVAFPCSFRVQLSTRLGGERKGKCLVRWEPSAGHCARVRDCRCRKRVGVWRRRALVVGSRAVQRGGATVPAAHPARNNVGLQSGARREGEAKGVRRRRSREVGSLQRAERSVLDPRLRLPSSRNALRVSSISNIVG